MPNSCFSTFMATNTKKKTVKVKPKTTTSKPAKPKKKPVKAKSDNAKPKTARAKPKTKTTKTKATKTKATKSKPKKTNVTKLTRPDEPHHDDIGIVIVDDDIMIDQEKVNEERRAYLEEARSQEAFD